MFVGKLIQELRKLARATTPRDSEDIVFSHGPDGFEARLRPKPKPSAPQPQQAAGDASPYSGMFAVTDTTDYSGEAPYDYKIDMVGGLAQLESKYHTITALADFTITEDGYLTLEFDVEEEGGAITYDAENKTTGNAAADLPIYKGRTIVARLTIADNKLTVIQTQYGVAIVTVRTPEEPEEETP